MKLTSRFAADTVFTGILVTATFTDRFQAHHMKISVTDDCASQ